MNNYPLIKFVLIFICGIFFQSILNFEKLPFLVVLGAILFLLLLLFIWKKKTSYAIKTFLIFSAIFISGMLHYSFFRNEKATYPFELPLNKNSTVIGKVTEINLIRSDRIIFYLETDSIKIGDKSVKKKINLICTLKDTKRKLAIFYPIIQIGNGVEVNGTIARARDDRNPGEFDYESYISEIGIHGLLIVYKTDDIKFISKDYYRFPQFAFEIRKSIDEQINKFHNNSTTSLLRGLLLADRGMIDFDTKTEFINAGVIHVLAVSGLHVGFIVLIFVFLFKRFNVYLRYGFTIFGLLLFLMITNYPPSVVRATIMAIVMVAAPLTGRNYNSINALALAAFIILLFKPSDLFNPGFQLSFSAVLAIVIFYPPLGRKINSMEIKSGVIKYLLLFCAVSLSAQIGTLPFTLVYFHKLSIVALAANFIVIPMIGLIVGLGIFTLAVGPLISLIGNFYASANELLTFFLFSFVRFFGQFEYSFISIRQFSIYDSIVFYVVIAFIFNFWKMLENWKSKIIVLLLLIAILFTGFRVDNDEMLPDGKLSVMAIDIGQGDAILIKFPNGTTALVDAGDATDNFDNGERIIIPLLKYLGIEKIDYGFISHVDADHYRGYYSLIKKQLVGKIIKPKLDSTETKDIELEKFIRSHKLPIHYYQKEIMKIANARIYLLNDTLIQDYHSLSSNDRSGMLKIVFGGTSFLLTGDAGLKAEKFYFNKYQNFLNSTVLKAGHHGSKTSTGEVFLNFVKPEFAVISAGILNKFKHPSKEVLNLFSRNKTKVLRTDQMGGILLQSDGKEVEIINWQKK